LPKAHEVEKIGINGKARISILNQTHGGIVMDPSDDGPLSFDERKLKLESAFRKQEIELKQTELALRKDDLALGRNRSGQSPLLVAIVAIIGSIVTAIASIYVGAINNRTTIETETMHERFQLIEDAKTQGRQEEVSAVKSQLNKAAETGQVNQDSIRMFTEQLTAQALPIPSSANNQGDIWCYQEYDPNRDEGAFLISCNPSEKVCNTVRGNPRSPKIQTSCIHIAPSDLKLNLATGGFLGSSYRFSGTPFSFPPIKLR
jgi:hypothetical protein